MEHNRTSTKSVPFFVALVLEPEFGQDLEHCHRGLGNSPGPPSPGAGRAKGVQRCEPASENNCGLSKFGLQLGCFLRPGLLSFVYFSVLDSCCELLGLEE